MKSEKGVQWFHPVLLHVIYDCKNSNVPMGCFPLLRKNTFQTNYVPTLLTKIPNIHAHQPTQMDFK